MWQRIARMGILLGFMIVFCSILQAETVPNFPVLCEAIKKAENSTKYPYGIKSIDTHGDKEVARRICLNSMNNNWKRYQKTDKSKTFLDFVSDRWCPASVDELGHAVWARNVNYHLKAIKEA